MNIDASVIKSLIAAGAPDDVIEKVQKNNKRPDDFFDVWPENWESLCFFLSVQNHWVVVSGINGREYISLNYPSIESVIRTFNPVKKNKRAALYRDLRIVELAALEVLNSPRKD